MSTNTVRVHRTAFLAILGVALACTPNAPAQSIGPDFDDDGFADLAIGVPFESVGTVQNAGAVNVIYGNVGGISSAGNHFWHQNRSGVLDVAEANDQFGSSMTWADFDGDGYDDLAIGSPNEKIGPDTGAGAVAILYGSPIGLTDVGDQFWHQDSAGITDGAERNDHFGAALATGDFNGDGYGDLVVGVPGETIGTKIRCGAVHVLYGSASGLRATGSRFFHQDFGGMVGVAGTNDGFGTAFAHGDFDDDGYDDLAIGIPEKGSSEGSVHVMYGSAVGLLVFGNHVFSRAHLPSGSSVGGLGYSLTAGDFDGDGDDDLAVGMPFARIMGIRAGAVGVLFGVAGIGLRSVGSQIWHQDSPGVDGEPTPPPDNNPDSTTDLFGATLAVGDFNADGFADLVVGEPYDTIGEPCGSAHLLPGSIGGLTSVGSRYLHQDTPRMPGGNLEDDRFGQSLAVGDFDGDGTADLAIGIPGEDVWNVIDNAGAVIAIPGSASGLFLSMSQYLHQNIASIIDNSEREDGFGSGSMN